VWRGDGLLHVVHDDHVESSVVWGDSLVHHAHFGKRTLVVEGSAYSASGLFIQENDHRSPGKARPGGNKGHDANVALADLKRFFAEPNAAHRHRERVTFYTAFAQKHAHFLMI
jgi:hypothetical protein